MHQLVAILISIYIFPSLSLAQNQQPSTETLFKEYSKALYQIESVSVEANKKNSVGSGFQIAAQGYVVTNYHVVSDAVLYPHSFYIRTINVDKVEENAQVVDFDVVHDLAILKIKKASEIFFSLGISSDFNKGKKIFSMGNPLDLGMTVIEGLANGYMDKAIYQKMLTSLSLNPGMSGGPTIDESGKVIGINVATMGNSISFLVPVEFLLHLWQRAQSVDLTKKFNAFEKIQAQLIEQEDKYFESLFQNKWVNQKFGKFTVPSLIKDDFTCWGDPRDNDLSWIKYPYLECLVKDNIYISSSVEAQSLSFNYTWSESRTYDPLRFYFLKSEDLSKNYRFERANIYERDVNNFKCSADKVLIDGKPFWVSTCLRRYKELNKLYDANIIMSSLGQFESMLVIEVTLGAVRQETIEKFLHKFYKEIRWVK